MSMRDDEVNASELILQNILEKPRETALYIPGGCKTSFKELGVLASKARKSLEKLGVRQGDTVLLFEALGPVLYGSVIGMVSMGVSVVLVEPWMAVRRIHHVIDFVKPRAFLSNGIGQIWGMRVPAIRAIPHWLRTSRVLGESGTDIEVQGVDGESAAIITFTSGTTGLPKGMVRTHRYLIDQHHILTRALHGNGHAGPDLCIFANFVLSNLAAGRASVVIPPSWKKSHLKELDKLPGELSPETVTSGPAFLLKLMEHTQLSSLQSIHVGGALTDCAIFERGFAKWPNADWKHVYGSTEVEPVAVVDARKAVSESKRRSFFQSLCLGTPIAEIEARLEENTVWVTGPHVCPKYLANEEENQKNKQRDEKGRVWHRMGDRIRVMDNLWWYMGRENQKEEEFLNEQRIYSAIRSSAAFLEKNGDGVKRVYCQRASERAPMIRREFSDIRDIRETTIRRDRRHRSRIDRVKSKRRDLTCFWRG